MGLVAGRTRSLLLQDFLELASSFACEGTRIGDGLVTDAISVEMFCGGGLSPIARLNKNNNRYLGWMKHIAELLYLLL